MSRRRIQETALLILLAVCAAVGIETLAAGTPLRIAGGIALLLALPWIAASRLAPIRRGDMGSRLSTSGALAFASLILLGLLLSTATVGITTNRLVAGALIITVGLAVLGAPGERPSRPSTHWIRSPLGLILTLLAVAISAFAFTLARDRALTQARQETSYAAFFIGDGKRLSIGLRNSTNRAARFTVRDLRLSSASAIAVDVPPHGSRIVRGFVRKPPPLRPIQRLTPERSQPMNIRISIRVDGRAKGPPLKLSTFAP